MVKIKPFIVGCFFVTILVQCTKEGKIPDNPYLDPSHQQKTENPIDSAVKDWSIQALYRDIFYPTCANSGCHDGTFEPDFRTIESSYRSLVNVTPIKNDSLGSFLSRVIPGDAEGSMLTYRLTVNLGGNSGIMPLALEPNSDWPTKKEEYINRIKKWIDSGARDTKGFAPISPNYPVQIFGTALMSGGNMQPRGGKYEPIYASAGNYELVVALHDDQLNQAQLSGVKLNLSENPNFYDALNEKSFTKLPAPLVQQGIFSSSTEYYFTIPLDLSAYVQGQVIWLRVSVDDGTNGMVHLPSASSMFFLKKYLAIKIL